MHEMALRSGCTPGMAGASKALKLLLFDGGDWADPEVRKFRFFSRPLLLLGRPPCGPALGGGAGAITARAHPVSDAPPVIRNRKNRACREYRSQAIKNTF